MKNTIDALAKYYLLPGFLLRRANQISVWLFAEECGEMLTPPQFTALILISWIPGIDQMGVSRIVGFDRSTTALVITNLLKNNWIARVQDEHDRRRYHLSITPAGAHLLREIKPKAARTNKRIVEGFSKDEINTLVTLLNKFVSLHNDATRAPIDVSALALTHTRLRRNAKKTD